jgi:hypothetical protein
MYCTCTRHFQLALLAAFVLFCTDKSASAQSLYWDTNSVTAGSGAATGTWGTSNFWNTDSTGGSAGAFTSATVNTSDLFFSAGTNGTTGTVTVSSAQVANSITFQTNAVTTISGGTSITLGGGGSAIPTGIFALGNVTVNDTVSTALILGSASTLQNAGTGILTFGGGVTGAFALALNNNNATPNGITLSTGSVNNVGLVTNSGIGTGSVLISSVIGTNVTGVVQNSSSSALNLSGVNLFTTPLTITSGQVNASSAVTSTGAQSASNSIVLGGATTSGFLNYSGSAGTISRTFTINAGGGEIDSTAALLTLNQQINLANGSLTLGGANNITINTGAANPITSSSVTSALTKIGAGILTINSPTGTAAVSGAVPININGGTFNYTFATVGTATNLLGTGPISITPGATLFFSVGTTTDTLPNNYTINNAAGIATFSISGGITNSGPVSFAAGAASPTLRLINTNGTAFTLAFSGGFSGPGNLQLSGTGNASPIVLSGALVDNGGSIANIGTNVGGAVTISASIGPDVTNITQNGVAPMTISGANTNFVGTINLTAGTLNINNANALGATNSGGLLFVSGGALGNTSAGAITSLANNTTAIAGDFSFTGTQALNLAGGAAYVFGPRTITVSTSTLTLGSTTGTVGFTKLGAGTLTLTGPGAYFGAIVIGVPGATTNGGALTLNGSGSIIGSTSYSVAGIGSQLGLDYSGAVANATINRIGDSTPIGCNRVSGAGFPVVRTCPSRKDGL